MTIKIFGLRLTPFHFIALYFIYFWVTDPEYVIGTIFVVGGWLICMGHAAEMHDIEAKAKAKEGQTLPTEIK